jgi:hypothetical protein
MLANIQPVRCWMLPDKTKPAQPFSCAGWIASMKSALALLGEVGFAQ